MFDQILALVKSLFADDADVAAIIAEIANLIAEAIFGYVKDSEGYNA